MNKKHEVKNKIKQIVRTPLYKMRVVENKTKYKRQKVNKKDYMVNILTLMYLLYSLLK